MDLERIRKQLHQHPEISGEEQHTQEFILQQLQKFSSIKLYDNFAHRAILAEINFEQPGKTLLFRAELDALPIDETNSLKHRSSISGKMHACGHDGHMTILVGLAEKLHENPLQKGTILLLFQPAEEIGKGAQQVLESQLLSNFSIDFVFALHNIPGYPKHEIICKEGSFTPSVESFDLHLTGKESHAGMPEKGINPALCLSKCIQFLDDIHDADEQSDTYFLATPIYINMGKPAYGTAAGKAQISYTLRTWEHRLFTKQKEKIIHQLNQLAKAENLQTHWEWKEAFAANRNHEEAYQLIKSAANDCELSFTQKPLPFSWGEDFGLFTQAYPGAMFGLGAGKNQPELHNPDYDFPDELLPTGIRLFYEIAKKALL